MRLTEFEIITDVTSSNEAKPKILLHNDKVKKLFDLDTIELEEFIDLKTGKHIKKYSSVLYNNNWYKINKPYEELKNIMSNKSIPILGFASKSKKYK